MTSAAAAVPVLRELLALSEDCERAYRDASLRAQDAELRAIFEDLAAARRRMIGDLKQQIAAAGGRVSEAGTIRGMAERLVAGLETSILQRHRTRDALVGQVREADERALAAFREAVAGAVLPEPIREEVTAMADMLETALAGLEAVSRKEA